MPALAPLHPVIVHFVIALGVVGVLLRILSLLKRDTWMTPAATALIVLAAIAAVPAAKSGVEAHGPAERVPGARAAVQKHEHDGERARNILLALGAIELIALALRSRAGVARGLHAASALVGLVAAYQLYETGEHGGELVYSYAGGVGTRTGATADVQRLLIAGLYHQARAARDSGRADEAARLTSELVQQMPGDPMVGLLAVESQIKDRKDAAGAIAALRAAAGPTDQQMFVVRRGTLLADAFVALGQTDSARAVLTDLKGKFPQARSVQAALDKLK
jgi:uncharacterized membrane protein